MMVKYEIGVVDKEARLLFILKQGLININHVLLLEKICQLYENLLTKDVLQEGDSINFVYGDIQWKK